MEPLTLRLLSVSHKDGAARPLRVASAKVDCHAHIVAHASNHTTSRKDERPSVINLGVPGLCFSWRKSERQFRSQRVADRKERHSPFDKLHAVTVNAHRCAADIGHTYSDDLGPIEALAAESRQVIWSAVASDKSRCGSGSPKNPMNECEPNSTPVKNPRVHLPTS